MASRGTEKAASQSRIPVKNTASHSPAAKMAKSATSTPTAIPTTAATVPTGSTITLPVANGNQVGNNNNNNSDWMLSGIRATNEKLRLEIKRLKKVRMTMTVKAQR